MFFEKNGVLFWCLNFRYFIFQRYLFDKNRVFSILELPLFYNYWYLKSPKPYFYRVFCAPFWVHFFVFLAPFFENPIFIGFFAPFLVYVFDLFGSIFKNPIFIGFFSTSDFISFFLQNFLFCVMLRCYRYV